MKRLLLALAGLLLALAGLLIAAPAIAGNGMSGTPTVQVERQLYSAAIKAIVGGDDDSSAVGRIFQRWQGGSYDTGMVMVRRPHGGGSDAAHSGEIFEARIMLPQQNRVCEWYIEFTDAGGKFDYHSSGSPDTVSAAEVRKLGSTVAGGTLGSGPRIWVSMSGNDNNPGTFALPKRTINKALDSLATTANEGNLGGIMLIGPGEWHERLDINSSRFHTDGYFHYIEGYGNRDSIIVCGANENVERGYLDATHKLGTWVYTGQDSTYKLYYPAATGPGDSTQLVVIGWNEFILWKPSIRAVLNDSTWGGIGFEVNDGELSGWYWQHDTLYVKRRNGKSPAGTVLHVGYRDNMIDCRRRNWRFANFTIRFSGGVTNNALLDGTDPNNWRTRSNPGYNGRGILGGTSNTNACGTVVDSVRMYGMNGRAIEFNTFQRTDSAVVANCIFDNLTQGNMSYGASKTHADEVAGQIYVVGRAYSIVNNTVVGLANGIGVSGSNTDSSQTSAGEIYGNYVANVSDDAFEIDGSALINVLVAYNVTHRTGRAFSQTTDYYGPCFVWFNQFVYYLTVGVKGAVGSTALMRFQHNTISSSAANSVAVDCGAGGTQDGWFFENNVLGGGRGTSDGSMMHGPSAGTVNSFNWDLMDSTAASVLQVAQWPAATPRTLAGLQSALGWEKNGIQAATTFVDSAHFNYMLGPYTFTTRKGRKITGVNTGLNGPLYVGTAPDMGAVLRSPPGNP